MSLLPSSFLALLLSGAAFGAPQPVNEARAVTTTGSVCSCAIATSSAISPKASSATVSPSSTRSSTAPLASSNVPTKSGCVWNVPGAGSFTQMSNFTFNDATLPSGLQVSSYTVDDKAPFAHQFTTSNVFIDDSFLQLRVPGGQTKAPLKSAEVVTTASDILYGSVRIRAIFSDVPGTCAGMFFYKNDTQEIDIEYLSDPNSLSNPGPSYPPPLQLTNQAVVAGGKATYSTASPPDDVTMVHDYRIDWLPGRTLFYLDGTLLKTYTTNVPTAGSSFILNNWSNGDQGWSVGPPKADNLFKIQMIELFYNTTSSSKVTC
jgi:beta-glucanase (GH16 family)